MSLEVSKLPGSELSMGEQLIRFERRERITTLIKISIVWVLLLALIFAALLAMQFDILFVAENFHYVLEGLGVTVGISLASVLLASILAMSGALSRISSNSILQGVSGLYVSLFRGTPLLVQVYIVYFGVARLGVFLMSSVSEDFGKLFILSPTVSGILVLGLNYGAYMTEIFRAGIQSISHGQWEAAQTIGMTRWQTMYRIILPQAVRVIIPDIGNQFIAMQKDSALVSVLGVWEITYLARQHGRAESKYLEMFLAGALVYWLLTIVSTYFQDRLERRMAHAYER